MRPLAVRAFSTVSAAGIGQAALLQALRDAGTRLSPNTPGEPALATHVGRAAALDDEAPGAPPILPPELAEHWDARATRLAWLGLHADDFALQARQAVARHGAGRVGLALGTSASTIGVTEAAYRHLAPDGGFPPAMRHERLNTPHALALFTAEVLGIDGPAVTVSTACSSSAKVFALAARWLRLDLVDAVVVGGVDALGASLLWGFAALGLLSAQPCRPFDRRRDGISLAEAAGFALLERDEDAGQAAARGAAPPPLRLAGHGEASDAFHMSSPHPQGLGAELALDAALARAGITGEAVDYVNLHGTASTRNDAVEAALVARRYGPRTLLSATKGLTGHAMGAAGMLEAAVCLLALRHGLAPGTTGCEEPDPVCDERLVLKPRAHAMRIAASHSFGFGGSNAVLVFAAAP